MEITGNKRKQTKSTIKAIGTKSFKDKGISDTTVADIATEAGIDRRTVYRYYPSKEHLLLDITKDLWSDFADKFMAVKFKDSMNGFQKVRHLFEEYFALLEESPDMIIFLGMIDISVGQNHTNLEMYQTLNEYGDKTDHKLAGLIEEGQNDGSIKHWLPPMEYAIMVNNSFVALATRIAIYIPNALIRSEGNTWKMLINQGQILINSMENTK